MEYIVPLWNGLTQGVAFALLGSREDERGGTMKITLLSENSIRLEPTAGSMTIEALSDEQSYSPFHMVASGLATCTFSVLYAWAEHAKLSVDDLTLEVGWEFADEPHRVGRYDVRFAWPSLPAKRLEAAKRVAELCTVHATLSQPPTIVIDGTVATPDVPTPPPNPGSEQASAA
jgi:uncharacterized OsmC-like protein